MATRKSILAWKIPGTEEPVKSQTRLSIHTHPETVREVSSFEQKVAILLTWPHIGHNECCTFFQYNPVSSRLALPCSGEQTQVWFLDIKPSNIQWTSWPTKVYHIKILYISFISLTFFLIFMAYFHTLEFVFIRTSISFVLLNHLEECDKLLTF